MLKKIILASLFTCSIPILAFSQSHELRVGVTSGLPILQDQEAILDHS
ncbi:hypothetical protein ABE545_21345 [Sphingobacterium faecium]|jgi:hypothetical protein